MKLLFIGVFKEKHRFFVLDSKNIFFPYKNPFIFTHYSPLDIPYYIGYDICER